MAKPVIWKVRTIKDYPEAHNHLVIGKVLEITDAFVRMHCRTYHFKKKLREAKDVSVGNIMNRVIPWGRIEIVNEMPNTFDYVRSTLVANEENKVIFSSEDENEGTD